MKEVVKITKTGKVNITLSKSVRSDFRELLEFFIEDTAAYINARKSQNLNSIKERVYLILLQEAHWKYDMRMRILTGDSIISLTKAQALAYWELSTDWPCRVNNPELGNILLKLHQKLL